MNKTAVWANDNSMNQTYIFVKELSSPIKQKIDIAISASDFYKIYINGIAIYYGPYRTEKNNISNDKLHTVIKKGKNNIAIIVQHYGACCFSTQKREPFLSINIQGKDISLSEKDFTCHNFTERIKKCQRYSYQRGFAESYVLDKDFKELLQDYLSKPSIKTQTMLTPNVIEPLFDLPILNDRIYAEILISGQFVRDNDKPTWKDRSIYQVGNKFEGFYYDDLEECISDTVSQFVYTPKSEKSNIINKNEYSVYGFEREITGFINVELQVLEDCELYITFDELLKEDKYIDAFRLDCCNVIKYKLKKGEYRLDNLEPYSYKYISVNVTKGLVDIKKVSSVLVENKNAYNIKFKIQDETLQNICEASCHTLAQNTWDYASDCPSRERACWVNDLYYTKDSIEMFFGDTNLTFASIRNILLDENNEDLQQGVIPMCFPSNFLNSEYVPNILMWFILITCDLIKKKNIGDYYNISKEKIYSAIKFLDEFINDDGLLEDLQGWVFVEWSSANSKNFVSGVNYPSNMLYLKALHETGVLFNDNKLTERADKMKTVIEKQSFNGEFFEDNRIRNEKGDLIKTGNISEVCQYFSFFCGIADNEKHSDLYNKLKNEFGPNRDLSKSYSSIDKANIITGILERANILLNYGERQKVLQEMIDVYSIMAKTNNTLWEKTSLKASCNHGIASYGGYIIVKALTGLKNYEENGISFDDDYIKDYNYEISIPFRNQAYIVRVKNGKRTIKIK